MEIMDGDLFQHSVSESSNNSLRNNIHVNCLLPGKWR